MAFCFSAAFWKNDSKEAAAFLVVALASELVAGTFGRGLESLLRKEVMPVQDEGVEAANLVAQRKSIVRGGDLFTK